MKYLILYLMLSVGLFAQSTKVGGSGTTKVGGSGTTKVTVASGGPDVWYESVANASATTSQGGNANDIVWDVVDVLQSGTATKLRCKVNAHFGGSEVVKLALYNGTTLMSSGTVSVTTTGLFEATLAVPQAVVVQSYNVMLSWVGSAADLSRTATNTYSRNNATSYASAPPATLPASTSTPAGDMYAAIFVD